MLGWRLLSSAVILAVLVGLLWLDANFSGPAPGAWLVPLVLLLAALLVAELLALLRGGGQRPSAAAAYGGCLGVVAASCVPVVWPLWGQPYPSDCPLGRLGWPLGALALSIAWTGAWELGRYRQTGTASVQWALSMLIVTYVGVPLASLVALRQVHGDQWGMLALVAMVAIVKLADTAAYFTGRAVGRHRMAPLVSPKKTWEGAAGAFVGAALASWAIFAWLAPAMVGPVAGPGWRWLLFGLVLAAAGMLGDLIESMLKRDVGSKDSSQWLPGLGGVLDTLDSILVAAPVAWLAWTAQLIAPAAGS